MRILIPKIILALAACTVSLAHADENVYSNLNCALVFPQGWKEIPVEQPNYVAIVKSPDGLRSVVLKVYPVTNPQSTKVNDEFRRLARQAFVREGHLVSEKPMTIDGFPSFELSGSLSIQGSTITTVSRIVIAGNNAYKINALFMDGEALSDDSLQKCLNSFRVLHHPDLPVHGGPMVLIGGLIVIATIFSAVCWIGVWIIRRQRRIKPVRDNE